MSAPRLLRLIDRKIVDQEIDPVIVEAAAKLPVAPERYFAPLDGTELIATDKLVISELQRDRALKAAANMRRAYDGGQDKRAPIAVQPRGDGRFLVVDGKSSATVAIAARWPELPCAVDRGAATVGGVPTAIPH